MNFLRVLSSRRLPVVFGTVVVVGACTVIGPAPSPTASPAPTASASPAPSPSASVSPSTSSICGAPILKARITSWDGAAGHRVATIQLTNSGTQACAIPELAQPRLIDGADTVLIDSAPPTGPSLVTVAAGGMLTTMVQDGNYCGPSPTAPVTVSFLFGLGIGRVDADPLSATDTTGVPPCLGPPGSAGDIEMQPWT